MELTTLALWSSQALSLVADDIQQFALKLQIHDANNRLGDLTLFILAVELPALIFSPLIGCYVDRFPKHVTILVVCVMTTLALAFEFSLGNEAVRWHLVYLFCCINSMANVLQFNY